MDQEKCCKASIDKAPQILKFLYINSYEMVICMRSKTFDTQKSGQ